jgi:hypothetical protein
VSWVDSIEAIAFARHVYNEPSSLLQPQVERELAATWNKDGMYNRMAWHQVGKFASISKNNIAMTADDDELRFFEAGYLAREALLFIGHDCPLISCLVEAVQSSESSDSRWVVIV